MHHRLRFTVALIICLFGFNAIGQTAAGRQAAPCLSPYNGSVNILTILRGFQPNTSSITLNPGHYVVSSAGSSSALWRSPLWSVPFSIGSHTFKVANSEYYADCKGPGGVMTYLDPEEVANPYTSTPSQINWLVHYDMVVVSGGSNSACEWEEEPGDCDDESPGSGGPTVSDSDCEYVEDVCIDVYIPGVGWAELFCGDVMICGS